MTRVIDHLADIAGSYDAVYCDLWGCLHDGKAPFPAAVAALAAVKARGGIVVLLTNSPRPKPGVIRQLDRLGVPRAIYDEVVSSGDAAQFALFSGAVGRNVYHLGPERDLSFFHDTAEDVENTGDITRVPLAEAEGIVCTGLFDDLTETPRDYRGTLLAAKIRRLPLLCANPDLVVDHGGQRIYCAGALAALYTEMGGTSLYFGKPHPPIYDLAAKRLARLAGGEVPSSRILAIGDGISTDIQGAAGEGIDAVFVTGGLAAAEFGADPEAPEPARLDAWLSDRQASPAYAIGKLR